MVDSVVSETSLVIRSHRGPYTVFFDDTLRSNTDPLFEGEPHFLIDSNVVRLYGVGLRSIIDHPHTIVIEATEKNKSIEKVIPVLERLVQNRVRRDHVLVAIGGGIIQDITCFIASNLLRGVPWRFVPTTLLSQADSCIGSKSSINLGTTKNILGTFNPPEKIYIDEGFLDTLEDKDIRSGIGEIIKVHAIDGVAAFDRLAGELDQLLLDRVVLRSYIQSALLIKQRFIEEDEFDQGIRNIFNYGHSFGHAIESATNYAIPHGIAVAVGMDMANYIAVERGLLSREHFIRMQPALRKIYSGYEKMSIPIDNLIPALLKDKKNVGAMLGLVFPVGEGAEIQKSMVYSDDNFRSQCEKFLVEMSK
jgi:3-dehydroquinate synthase